MIIIPLAGTTPITITILIITPKETIENFAVQNL